MITSVLSTVKGDVYTCTLRSGVHGKDLLLIIMIYAPVSQASWCNMTFISC